MTGLSKLVTQIWPPTWRVDKTTKWFPMRIWRQQSDVWKCGRGSLEITRLHLRHSGIGWGRSWWNQCVSHSHGKHLRTCHQFLRATESCHGMVRFHKLAHDGWGRTLKGLWNPWATEIYLYCFQQVAWTSPIFTCTIYLKKKKRKRGCGGTKLSGTLKNPTRSSSTPAVSCIPFIFPFLSLLIS